MKKTNKVNEGYNGNKGMKGREYPKTINPSSPSFPFIPFIALFALFTFPIDAKEKYGIISRLSGEVSLRPQGGREFRPMADKDFVYFGDTIRTSGRSQVAILLVDGAEVKINERSLVTLDKVYDQDPSGARRLVRSVFMDFGQSWTKLFHGRGGQSMAIQSNVAVCAVRGTEAAFAVTPPAETKRVVKVKVKKSQILKKGLEGVKKENAAAKQDEARQKKELKNARTEEKLAQKKADEAEKEALALKKRADEARVQAEELAKRLIADASEEAARKRQKAEALALDLEKKAREAAAKAAEQNRTLEFAKSDAAAREGGLAEIIAVREASAKEMIRLEKELKLTLKDRNKDAEQEITKEITDQKMDVSVLEGHIDVINDEGRQSVGAGETLSVASGKAPEPPQKMSDQTKPKWQEEIKITDTMKNDLYQQLEKAPGDAPKYVPDRTLDIEVEKDGERKNLKLKLKKN